jgi:DnaJ-domain-containing protein 1
VAAAKFWVVVACLLVGYWVVSKLIDKGKAADEGPRDDPTGATNEESATRTGASEGQSSAPRYASWYEVLEIREDASSAEIKAAYRRLMTQYHPDKVSSLGKELRELAEAKSKEITQAYRCAMQFRGESL